MHYKLDSCMDNVFILIRRETYIHSRYIIIWGIIKFLSSVARVIDRQYVRIQVTSASNYWFSIFSIRRIWSFVFLLTDHKQTQVFNVYCCCSTIFDNDVFCVMSRHLKSRSSPYSLDHTQHQSGYKIHNCFLKHIYIQNAHR